MAKAKQIIRVPMRQNAQGIWVIDLPNFEMVVADYDAKTADIIVPITDFPDSLKDTVSNAAVDPGKGVSSLVLSPSAKSDWDKHLKKVYPFDTAYVADIK